MERMLRTMCHFVGTNVASLEGGAELVHFPVSFYKERMDVNAISRKEALAKGLKHYFTGKPCRHGHVRNRLSSNGMCLGCKSLHYRTSYPENKTKAAKRFKSWHSKNPNRRRGYSATRRALEKQAKPLWLSDAQHQEIQKIYDTCPLDSHVDHIIPLAGQNVCGLHVPWNLQHLTKEENLAKGNRF